jgi:hypothetical protein
MSWPAPAVVWQAPRSGATPKNASKIRLESIILLYMEITLLRGSKRTFIKSIAAAGPNWPLRQTRRGIEDYQYCRYRQHAHDERGHELNVADCRMIRSWPRHTPIHRVIERLGTVTSGPFLDGLHHQYCRI